MDPFDARTDGFSFGSNAAGAQWDGTMYEGSKVDLSWDNKWYSVVKNYPDKWVFEAHSENQENNDRLSLNRQE